MDKAAFSKLIPGVMRMSQIFSDHKKLMPARRFIIDWVPGTGTRRHGQGRAAGRAVQGAGVLQRAAAHLAGPQPGRLETQGSAAGQAGLSAALAQPAGSSASESRKPSASTRAHRLAVVVAIGHQQHRAAGGARGPRVVARVADHQRRRGRRPSASQVLSKGRGSGFFRSKASPPKTTSKNPASPLACEQRPCEGGGLVGEAGQPQTRRLAVPPAPRSRRDTPSSSWPLMAR